MPIAWFVAPYERFDPQPNMPARRCVIGAFAGQIRTDNGIDPGGEPGRRDPFVFAEVLGNHAICKVRASQATLDELAALPNVDRIPKGALNDSLSDLSSAAKTRIRDKLLALGYSSAEITARFGGDLGAHTLGDVLRFMAQRWRPPRYDAGTDSIVFDQPARLPPMQVETADGAVS